MNITAHHIDYDSEASIELATLLSSNSAPLDIVIVDTVKLHDDNVQPENSLADLTLENTADLFKAKTIVPALIAKHFTPRLIKQNKSSFTAISARVSSISDYQLRDWHTYRTSRTTLNMIIKTAATEVKRQNKKAIDVGLHPVTDDSNLSKPFQANAPESKLFTAKFSA